MNKEYEYFAEFFNDPTQYNNHDFHELMREWVEYMNEHAGEFNYLEDEEWRERRETILDDIERRVELREEFDELTTFFAADAPDDDYKRLEMQFRYVRFLKNNQFDFGFADELIAAAEKDLSTLARMIDECRILEKRAEAARLQKMKSVAQLDNVLAKYYEKTGKQIVLPAYAFKRKPKGN